MLEQKVVVGLTVAVPFVCNRPGVGCWLDFPILGGCCFSKAQISVWGNSTVQSGEFPGLGSWKDLLSRAKNSSWIFYYRSLASVIRHHGSTFFFEFSKENPISLPRLQDEICFSSLCQREHPRGLCFSCKRLSWLFFFFFSRTLIRQHKRLLPTASRLGFWNWVHVVESEWHHMSSAFHRKRNLLWNDWGTDWWEPILTREATWICRKK